PLIAEPTPCPGRPRSQFLARRSPAGGSLHAEPREPMKANDIRKGAVIYYEGKPHLVMDFTHRTPGNLRAFVQVRLRNLKSGMSLDHRFSATENVEEARLDTRTVQVLYADANGVHVMDANTYEQFTLDPEVVGEDAAWMLPEMRVDATWLEGRAISFQLPSSAELEVVETSP